MDSAARMALYTTLKVIEEAQGLRFDVAGEKVQGLHACFERAAELTGSSPPSLKSLFWSHFETDGGTYEVADISKRGRGSDSVDKVSICKVKPEQAAAISAFIKFANSSEGAAKVNRPPTPSPRSSTPHTPQPFLNPNPMPHPWSLSTRSASTWSSGPMREAKSQQITRTTVNTPRGQRPLHLARLVPCARGVGGTARRWGGGGSATGKGLPLTVATSTTWVWDNDDGKGAAAEAIAQEDMQIAADHISGIIC